MRIGHDAAGFLEQHRGAHVVGMTRQRLGVDERPEVGDEAIVADDQLVELPARRDVLVVEHVTAAEASEQLRLQLGERGLARHEELRQAREPVFEVGGRRRPHGERRAPPVAQVDPLGVDAAIPRPTELIRRTLFRGRGARSSPRRRRRATNRREVLPRRDTMQRVVVHQPAGAVDGVDDDRPRRVVADHHRLVEAFRHHLDSRPVLLEPLQQGVVGDLVDGVDGVGDGLHPRSSPCRCRGHPRRRRGCGHRARTAAGERRQEMDQESAPRSSAAFSSGSDSLVIEPPPISGPARYFSSPGARSGGCSSTWNG